MVHKHKEFLFNETESDFRTNKTAFRILLPYHNKKMEHHLLRKFIGERLQGLLQWRGTQVKCSPIYRDSKRQDFCARTDGLTDCLLKLLCSRRLPTIHASWIHSLIQFVGEVDFWFLFSPFVQLLQLRTMYLCRSLCSRNQSGARPSHQHKSSFCFVQSFASHL